jgi:DNA-binding NarL/FixJ family response regulator
MIKREPGVRKQKHRVFIVDDHPIVRKGLTQLINQEPDLVVCGEAEDAHKALVLLKGSKPDLVLVDISLQGVDGIELIKGIKLRYVNLPVLVISMHDESLFAERALRAGARGYIMKQEAMDKMKGAIRKVLKGELYVSERISAKMLEQFIEGKPEKISTPVDVLSDRELEVFRLIGRGLGTRQIAQEIRVSVKTVDSYRAHIKEKLKLENATELMKHAIHWSEDEKKPS